MKLYETKMEEVVTTREVTVRNQKLDKALDELLSTPKSTQDIIAAVFWLMDKPSWPEADQYVRSHRKYDKYIYTQDIQYVPHEGNK